MSLQPSCDFTEATDLVPSLGLYLKPCFKIKISVQLPSLKTPGQSISMYEVMEKLKTAIRTEIFLSLKVIKTNSTHIQLEGELETRASCDRALNKLQSTRGVKLANFPEFLQVKAVLLTSSHPTRHDWTAFFRDVRDMDEMKPGERPDTIHIRDLPMCWFTAPGSTVPCEQLLKRTFEVFGIVRRLEVPTLFSGAFGKVSTLHRFPLFEIYVQYEEYDGFVRAMDSLRGQKLFHKNDKDKGFTVDLKVDFDRTNYLSDKNIKKRQLERKKSVDVDCVAKTKSSITSSSSSVCHITAEKIVKPERNKIESMLLLKELLLHAEVKERKKQEELNKLEVIKLKNKVQKEDIKRNKERLLQKEQTLRDKLLKKLKAREEKKKDRLQKNSQKKIPQKKIVKRVHVKSNKKKRT